MPERKRSYFRSISSSKIVLKEKNIAFTNFEAFWAFETILATLTVDRTKVKADDEGEEQFEMIGDLVNASRSASLCDCSDCQCYEFKDKPLFKSEKDYGKLLTFAGVRGADDGFTMKECSFKFLGRGFLRSKTCPEFTIVSKDVSQSKSW